MRADVRLRNGIRLRGVGQVVCARDGGLDPVDVRDLVAGDWVGLAYGEGLARAGLVEFGDFDFDEPHGSQKRIALPTHLTPDLALLLGMYASEGHTTASNYTVTLTNSVPAVLARAGAILRDVFGLESRLATPARKCPMLHASSKTLTSFMGQLGCGRRASDKRIPRVVMESPEPVVLAFLQGLFLDAYTAIQGTTGKWAICLDSPLLLDDLQTLLRWMGIVTARNSKYNAKYGKSYDEVFASGREAQKLLRMVEFLEPAKAARASQLLALSVDERRNGADVVPLVHGRELYAEIPSGTGGRGSAGSGVSLQWRALVDPRTSWPSRHMVERFAAGGYRLPPDLEHVLDANLHFSQVRGCAA